MARLPVPGSALTGSPDVALIEAIPTEVRAVLETLRTAGFDAYLVGGSLRDILLGRNPADWDIATSARPEQTQSIFPGSLYENVFGTVALRQGQEDFEITTFRRDHDYADHRRPHRVEFGDDIRVDLARRDFTVNALAWGGRPDESLGVVDPYGGRDDLGRRVLRAVGDPDARFAEDALRMIRAVRLAASIEFSIEPSTLLAIKRRAELVRHLSGELIAAELEKLLASRTPSIGLRPLASTGLLGVISPELAAQPGIPQNKVPGEDLWEHTLRTVDAALVSRPTVRLAALLHDLGKPATFVDNRFLGHEIEGARLAEELLGRLRLARTTTERVVHLVRQHMFAYQPGWGDAAVRRFIAKIGESSLDDLFALREADNLGSGRARDAGGLDGLRARVAEQLSAHVALRRPDLAIDGNDLIAELGLEPGPHLGRLLDRLVDAVLDDPGLNDRPTLLMLAQSNLERED